MAQNRLKPGTHGAVNIYKSDQGGYYAKVYYRDAWGKLKSTLVRANTKGAVRRKFNDRWHEMSKRMQAGSTLESITIERLFDEWAQYEDEKIQSLRARGLPPHIEPHTDHQYKALVRNHLIPRIADWELHEITVGNLDRLFLQLVNETSPNIAEKSRAILSRMFRHAVHQDWLSANLVRDTDPELIRGKESKPKALKPEDITAVREAAIAWENEFSNMKVPLLDTIDLMIGTGCRVSEALALHWVDVHFEEDQPWVHIRYAVKWHSGEGLVIGPTKGRKETRIGIPKFVTDLLLRRRVDSEHELVVHNKDGRFLRPEYVRKKLTLAMKNAGVNTFAIDGGFKTHLFRKTVLTAIERTYGLQAAATQAGHSRVSIT